MAGAIRDGHSAKVRRPPSIRVGRNELFVPFSAKVGPGALDWAERHSRGEAEFDFAAEVRRPMLAER